jgi:hypothetical protein
MAIPYITNPYDNTIGLVGISKHQGILRHTSHPIYIEGQRDIGNGAWRHQRTPLMQQFTGHTAVMSRVGGRVRIVRGFVPDGVIATVSMLTHWALPRLLWGREVAGHWQDDLAILADPTCVSVEIQVDREIANAFRDWIFDHEDSINRYSLQDSDAIGSFNCVAAAETMLLDFLYSNQIISQNILDFENILLYYGDVRQGTFMQMVISLPERI